MSDSPGETKGEFWATFVGDGFQGESFRTNLCMQKLEASD